MTEILKLSSIRIDGNTQLRAETNQDIVGRYAEDMHEGNVFPPVIVFYDDVDYWLADGFHRYFAVEQVGKDEIEAEIRQGTQRDAILYSAEANRKHGIQLTNRDKRHIVTVFLNDAEWVQWSDREIARHCGVSHMFVSTMRKVLTVNALQSDIRRGADGRTYNTANIGRALSTVDHTHRSLTDQEHERLVRTLTDFAQDDSSYDALVSSWTERYNFLRLSGRSLNDTCLKLLEEELCEAVNDWLGYIYIKPCTCSGGEAFIREDSPYPTATRMDA